MGCHTANRRTTIIGTTIATICTSTKQPFKEKKVKEEGGVWRERVQREEWRGRQKVEDTVVYVFTAAAIVEQYSIIRIHL